MTTTSGRLFVSRLVDARRRRTDDDGRTSRGGRARGGVNDSRTVEMSHARAAPANANAHVEPLSGTRISNRVTSGAVVRARFAERRLCAIGELEREIVGKYGFVGVVTEVKARTSAGGRAYATWEVSELKSGGARTTVSVFGDAFSAYGGDEKGSLGHIWAVLDAKFYRAQSVSVEDSSQLLKIGRATDFGVCKALKRDGEKCTKAVNVSECKFCEFHVPKAIRDVANASRVMTGKRNAEGDFKAGLQKYGAAMQPLKSGAGSHLTRLGEGALSGAPPPSIRAKQILKQSNVHVPRPAFQSKREFAPARKTSAAPKTMALEDDDEFEDDEATLQALAQQHASSIAQVRKDTERAKQRAAAERLKASGLTLTKTDPNDTSAKKPTAPVVAKPKPLPDALKSYGLQTTDTVEQLQKKLKAETVRRKELEAENEDLRRQLAAARGDAPPRPAMRDVSNRSKAPAGTKQSGTMSKTQMLFGHVGATDMNSRYEKDAEAEDDEAIMKKLDTLEERDQLAAQLAKKMETKVKVYHCTVCKKKTRFIDRDTCNAHMHAVKQVESTMRYFKCKACNQTNTSFDAFMPTRCERNGCTSVVFDRVSAADVTAAAKPRKDEMIAAEAAAGGQVASRDALAPRGVEHGFRLDTIHG